MCLLPFKEPSGNAAVAPAAPVSDADAHIAHHEEVAVYNGVEDFDPCNLVKPLRLVKHVHATL